MLLTIGTAVVVLGVLIFVHELGHFVAAKAVGIGVPRFSIGFGPATPLRFRRGETEYVVAWFPLGGYVKMASREEQEAMATVEGGPTEEFPPDKLFESKSLGARMVVILAGVVMNALFAWGAYAGLVAVVGKAVDPTTRVAVVDSMALPEVARPLGRVPAGARVVAINGDSVRSWNDIQQALLDPTTALLRFEFAGNVAPVVVPVPGTDLRTRGGLAMAVRPFWEARAGSVQGPAAQAGIAAGDVLLAVDGDTVRSWYEIPQRVEPRAGDTLTLRVQRGDSTFDVAVAPIAVSDTDPLTGTVRTVARLGIGQPQIGIERVRFGPGAAVVEGGRRVLHDVRLVLFTIKGMILRQISPRELGGPILIGQISGQFARLGLVPLLTFMAFLSVNLAVLNLLPIPVLDGGQLVFLLAEGVRGRPLPLQTRLRLTQFGMVLLLGLVVLVFTNDILRVFGG